jgi:predicted MFS family arabinose efflux permease
LLWCGYHVAKSVGTRYLGRAVDRVGPRPLLALGWVLYAGLEVAFAAATGVGPVLGLFLGGALFFALTEPAEKTLVAGLVGRDRRGRAFGLYQGAIGLAALPGGWLFGTLYDAGGPWAAFGLSAGLAVVAAGILALGRPEPAAPLATMGRGV